MTTDRPSCVICRRLASDGYVTDTRCADRLREALDDIAEYWPEVIDPDGKRSSGNAGRRAPGFASGVPIDLSVSALLDPTLRWEKPGDLRYPPDVVFGWGDTLDDEIGCGRWLTLDDTARTLARHLNHITRQPWVADMWDEINDVATQMAAVVGDIPRRLIGPCPTSINIEVDGGTETTRCGARLYAPLSGDTIRCGRCGTRVDRGDWRQLGAQIKVAQREAAETRLVRRPAA